MELTSSLLDSYLGMTIGDICLNGFNDNGKNHCAHFVAHVLRIGHGKTCRAMTHHSHHHGDPATILVPDLFEVTPDCHELLECPTTGQGIIFVSKPSNFKQIGSPNIFKVGGDLNRHVGIYIGATTWHYSNSKDKVIKQTTASFLNHYPSQTNALWIGDIPPGARPVPYGVSMP